MQYMNILLVLILTVIHTVISTKGGMLSELFHRGKSFFSRSMDFRHIEKPHLRFNFPEHRLQYNDLELLENNYVPHTHGQPQTPDHEPHHNTIQHEHKDKESDYVLYRTDIIENDNLDLYRLLGGISFASLLATTLFVLGRNRRSALGSNAKSLDEILGNNEKADNYRKHFNSKLHLEEFLTPEYKSLVYFRHKDRY